MANSSLLLYKLLGFRVITVGRLAASIRLSQRLIVIKLLEFIVDAKFTFLVDRLEICTLILKFSGLVSIDGRLSVKEIFPSIC